MKKIILKALTFITVLAVVLSVITVNVSAAGSSISFSKNKLNVGETLTVTARFSSSSNDLMYGLYGHLIYNPKVLEFVSASSGIKKLIDGTLRFALPITGETNVTATITFKALTAGQSAVSLERFVYPNEDETEEKTIADFSKNVTVVNSSATASSNANLKNLVVSAGTLTPKFNPDVISYSVTIENDVKELWVSATKADSKATYIVEGSKNMKVGFNKRTIIVTAENGKTKTYTINITRLDANGQQPETPSQDEDPLNDLIEVNVGDETMYVVEDFAGTETPTGFSVIEYAFNGKTVPALSDDNYIILMLRLPDDSKRSFYIYDKDGRFAELISVSVGGQTYHIIPTNEIPEGYTATDGYQIGDVLVPSYKSNKTELSDFIMIYAKGPSGYTGFYSFDTVDQTIQRAVGLVMQSEQDDPTDVVGNNVIDNFVNLNVNGKIIAITIVAILLLLVIAIIVLIVKIATFGRNRKQVSDEEEGVYLENDEYNGFEYISERDPVAESGLPYNIQRTFEQKEQEAEEDDSETEQEESCDEEDNTEE